MVCFFNDLLILPLTIHGNFCKNKNNNNNKNRKLHNVNYPHICAFFVCLFFTEYNKRPPLSYPQVME